MVAEEAELLDPGQLGSVPWRPLATTIFRELAYQANQEWNPRQEVFAVALPGSYASSIAGECCGNSKSMLV